MKKQAILYVRVSTDEQAEKGFSLAHQEERLRKHCEVNNIEVVGFYREDHSAKTFDRPEFTKLLMFGRKNKNLVNLLLFTKWDRFSRNAGDAYGMINQLNKIGIEPQAIEQPLDLAIPENKIMLAFYLASPEVENDRRSLNITVGMRRAMKEGRWVAKAPSGYKNIRNEKGAALIVIDDHFSKIMKWAFEELGKGIYPVAEIWKKAKAKGLTSSKSFFWRGLRNPVYYGYIQVPASKDEGAQLVKGIHEPLISEGLFYKVQDYLDGRKRIQTSKQSKHDELPLRGFLVCECCGKKVTGSASRGKLGERYFYYHCNYCKDVRFRADLANQKVEQLISKINPDNRIIRLLGSLTNEDFKIKGNGHQENNMNVSEIGKLKSRIENAQNLMLDGQISTIEYHQIKEKNQKEIIRLENKIGENKLLNKTLAQQIEFVNFFIKNPRKAYSETSLDGKQQILGSIFVQNLIFSEKNYRTPMLNPAIALYCNPDKALREIKKGLPIKNDEQSLKVQERLHLSNFIIDLQRIQILKNQLQF